jgi:hypothetical protein
VILDSDLCDDADEGLLALDGALLPLKRAEVGRELEGED